MSKKGLKLIETIGNSLDPDMTLGDIAGVISRMNDKYPTAETQRMARQLAEALGEVYLDKMCQQLMSAPFWNRKNTQ